MVQSPSAEGALVEYTTGAVKIVGWDKSELGISGSFGPGVERIDVEGTGENFIVRVVLKSDVGEDWGAGLCLSVPRGCAVAIETVRP
jgi:hypothetical protein